ncbi:MAG TPA: PEGA domain-containing protein [Gemmatimonadales bacterium]|nr:PEGA domain-containing protein [Gemmatimonadales bacterium]
MVLLVFVLLAVLGAGGYFIWPTLQELMGIKTSPPSTPQTATSGAEPAASQPAPPATASSTPAPEAQPPGKQPESAAKSQPEEAPATPPAKAEPDAAEWESAQKRIEQRIAQAGFSDRVRVERRGDAFELAGTLTSAERRQLLQRLRGSSGRFRMNDRIRLASAETAPEKTEPAERSGSEKPQTAPGMGEIEVITNVAGAMVTLRNPDNRVVGTRPTPTRFEDLPPGRYTMEIAKAGFRTARRIVNVREGKIEEEELTLEPTASGLVITSRPPGSSILINGQPRAETTPATIMLTPGRYTIGVVAEGFQRYETSVQLAENQLQEMNVQLQRLPGQGVGYIDVRTIPPGVDILVNDTNTGLKTPYKLELPAGDYTLVLFRRGYVTIRKTVTLREGQTITINERMTNSP